MNKTFVSIGAFIAAVTALTSFQLESKAHIIEVNNLSKDTVDIYVRAENKESPNTPYVILGPNIKTDIKQDISQAYMDVVAVSHGAAPDWNLTGGTCKHLLTTTDHTVIIDDSALGFKFSCKTIK